MVLVRPGYSNVNVHSAAGNVDGNSGEHEGAPEHRLLLADHYLLLCCQVFKRENESGAFMILIQNLKIYCLNLRSLLCSMILKSDSILIKEW